MEYSLQNFIIYFFDDHEYVTLGWSRTDTTLLFVPPQGGLVRIYSTPGYYHISGFVNIYNQPIQVSNPDAESLYVIPINGNYSENDYRGVFASITGRLFYRGVYSAPYYFSIALEEVATNVTYVNLDGLPESASLPLNQN